MKVVEKTVTDIFSFGATQSRATIDRLEVLLHFGVITLGNAFRENYSVQNTFGRVQRALPKLLSIAKDRGNALIALYPRVLIDSAPIDSKDALFRLIDHYYKDDLTRDELVSGIRYGFNSYEKLLNEHTPAYIVGYSLGKLALYGAQDSKNSSNKFRIRLPADQMRELNSVIDVLGIQTIDQAGGYTGWFAALSNRLKLKLIIPKLAGLCHQTLEMVTCGKSSETVIQQNENGTSSTVLSTCSEKSARNIPLTIEPFKLDPHREEFFKKIFAAAGLDELNATHLGKVKVNPTFVADNGRSNLSPPKWIFQKARFFHPKSGVIMPIGEKLTPDWKMALDFLLESSERTFVYGSWSGGVNKETILNAMRVKSKTPSRTTYLCSFNADEAFSALRLITTSDELLSKILLNLPSKDISAFNNLINQCERSSVEDLNRLVYTTKILQMALNADYVSCRTLDAEVTSYKPNRFPKSLIIRSLSYFASLGARYFVNQKLESTDPNGLPPESLSIVDLCAKFKEQDWDEIKNSVLKINSTLSSKNEPELQIKMNHLFDKKLNKHGIYNLDSGQGVISVTPLPRASRLESPEIGIGDTRDFIVATLLNLLYSFRSIKAI